MNNFLITGASGFLGKNLIRYFMSQTECEVWALTSNEGKLSEFQNEKLHIYQREFPFSKEFKEIEFDCAINCAYPRNTSGKQIADGLRYIAKLFKAFDLGNVKSIINISSQSVYDEQRENPASENADLSLNSCYAVGKYAVELILENTCTNIPYTNIRMASLIGVDFPQRIVNRLILKILNGEEIIINQSSQTFGFLDVKDAVVGIVSLLDINPNNWKLCYNIGNEKAYSMLDIVETIKEVIENKSIKMPEIKYEINTNAGSTAVSYELLKKDTGFEPSVNLKQSVEEIVNSLMKK